MCLGHISAKVSEGLKRNSPLPLRMCPSGVCLRESAMLNPSGLTPWVAFRERGARSYAACPGFGGREPSRFLGMKSWQSLKLTPLLPNN